MSIHRFIVSLGAAVACLLPAVAIAQTGTGGSGKAEQQVLQAEKDRFAAMIKGDRAALTRLLADDLTYTHTNTLFETKEQFIKSVTSGAIDYVSVTPSETDWKVRLEGNIALVNGVAAVNVIDNGKDLKFKIRYTTVHRNSGGQWQLLAWQATRFPQ
jgi:ketosteroid isomerase-like protein